MVQSKSIQFLVDGKKENSKKCKNAPGYLFIRNADATNYVQVGFATTVYHIRLKAGQVALLPIEPGETDIFLKANTAACDVELYLRAS